MDWELYWLQTRSTKMQLCVLSKSLRKIWAPREKGNVLWADYNGKFFLSFKCTVLSLFFDYKIFHLCSYVNILRSPCWRLLFLNHDFDARCAFKLFLNSEILWLKWKKICPQWGSNSRPLVYETSALPLSYTGFPYKLS